MRVLFEYPSLAENGRLAEVRPVFSNNVFLFPDEIGDIAAVFWSRQMS